jgi:hypothetical protein
MIDPNIKLVGQYGLTGLLLIIGYLFYDKNQAVSIIVLAIGIILTLSITSYEIAFKQKRHSAAWLFDNYKGE